MKTKHQILDDVVRHIKKQGGRAINKNGICKYITPDGKTCGHSMAIKPSKRKLCEGAAANVIGTYGDSIHQKKYQGHSAHFWLRVQVFHDNKRNFTETGELTIEGRQNLNTLKRRFE